jgi:DnaJ-class molecular chaperone
MRCPDCGGKKSVDSVRIGKYECQKCGGTGVVRKRKKRR